MPGGIGNTYANNLLSYLFGGTTFSLPSTYYFALFSVTPSDTGGGTELAGSGYSRVPVTNNTTNFPNASVVSGVETLTTGTSITWGPASGTWSTAVAVGVFDASTSGNLVAWGPLATGVTVTSGQSLVVSATNGVFTLV